MMAYFTHCCKSISLQLALPFLLTATLYTFTGFAFIQPAFAGGAIQIKSAELRPIDDYYSLAIDVDMRLDKDVEEAVNKGVPLNFIVEF